MLFYCEKCKQSVDIDVSGDNPGTFNLPDCPTCKNPYTYLGREAVVLSKNAKQELVEEQANTDSLSKHESKSSTSDTFSGKPKHYDKKQQDIKYLECKEFLAQQPNHIPSLIFMGLYQRSQGKYVKSIEFLEKAHGLDPKNVTILRHLSDIYLSVDRFEEAIGSLLKIRTLEPTNYIVYKNLGIAHIYAGKQPDGLMYFKWAASFCENEEIKEQLKQMVRDLSKEMDN